MHVVTIDAAREGTISAIRHSRRLRQTQAAPGTWPRAYTSLVSTFKTVAPSTGPGLTLATVASIGVPNGSTAGCPVATAPPASFQAGKPPASTLTLGRPIRLSHEAVITDLTKPSQTSTIVAARTAMYSSVAWTAWPPGAQTAPATCSPAYSSEVRTSSTATFS